MMGKVYACLDYKNKHLEGPQNQNDSSSFSPRIHVLSSYRVLSRFTVQGMSSILFNRL